VSGSLDTTFANNGRLIDVFGTSSSAVNALLSADDHIFVVGACGAPLSATCVARLTPDGALDTAYGSGGVVTLAGLLSGAAALLSDGRLIVGGATLGGASNGIATYSVIGASGTTGGLVSLPNGYPYLLQFGALGPDGSVVFVGSDWTLSSETNPTPTKIVFVAKLTKDGNIDGNFGTNGSVIASFAGVDEFDSAGIVVRQDNSKIAIGGFWRTGTSQGGYGILQLDGQSGAPDTSFGPDGNGQTTIQATGANYISAFAPLLLPSGQIISINRLDSISSLGTNSFYYIYTFTSNGVVSTNAVSGISNTVALLPSLDGQNRVLAAIAIPQENDDQTPGTSSSTTLESVMRLTTSGIPDATFGTGGITTLSLPASLSSSWGSFAARAQSDGRIIVLSQATMADTDGGTKDVVVVSRLWN